MLEYLKEIGLEVLRIKKMEESKHIFSHKEWHMTAYQIRVDELVPKGERLKQENWIFAESADVEKNYPLPSAFTAYTKYLNIAQGSGKIKK